MDAWKKVIQSHGLVWTQYRTGPEVISDLRITGLSLDESGKIVAKDLDTNQLAEFLNETELTGINGRQSCRLFHPDYHLETYPAFCFVWRLQNY